MADPRTAALSVAWFVPGRPAVRPRLRIAAFTVPERLRHVFWVLSAGEFLAWAVLGVFSAVIPSLFGEILATRNLAVTAGALTVMIGMSAVAQLAARRVPIVAAQVAGLAVLAAGLAMLVGATFTGSAALAVRRRCAAVSGTAWFSAERWCWSCCPRRRRNGPRSSGLSTSSTTPAWAAQ